ncbi:MAG: CDP-glycerol glycerophosphotransferase family protein [Defluviitaleaceae bacterium]|nr:CDP-glycerol glycerophosphotransferase family protein [Defluviitaleaceae bacterium]
MNKRHHNKILEIFKTITKAQEAKLYADCQTAALSLCDFIEAVSTDGEGVKTVKLLEKYCELLFKAHSGEVNDKPLKKHIIKIENSIKNDLQPRLEVVFLSYKASMSDCLESIYFAAKADPNCDAFWIPIPYNERNPNGSFGAMHLEGAEYYPHIPEITSWRDYDIEAQQPDVIFTFALYDAINLMTSVHPDFYCERLRELTDMLVVLPHQGGVGVKKESDCTLPGCIFAHKVILSGEKARNDYISIFERDCGHQYGDPNEKFIALGSPKYDKVLNAKSEDYDIPTDWMEIIKDKKVIFYNTSLGALFKGDKDYLTILRSSLEVLRNCKDIALWWRPHPLIKNAITSMMPHLVNEYTQIVNAYKEERYGIYDDTANLHRAIAYSHAYYGDGSSIYAMFRIAGKPFVVINQPYRNMVKCTEPILALKQLILDLLAEEDSVAFKQHLSDVITNEKLAEFHQRLSDIMTDEEIVEMIIQHLPNMQADNKVNYHRIVGHDRMVGFFKEASDIYLGRITNAGTAGKAIYEYVKNA